VQVVIVVGGRVQQHCLKVDGGPRHLEDLLLQGGGSVILHTYFLGPFLPNPLSKVFGQGSAKKKFGRW
jgi:hypothetical protein